MDLKEKAKKLPKKPGVYIMKDFIGNIIYIGKSKKLRDRVTSYFINNKNLSSKIQEMVSNIDTFEYILTDTELEAFLLESELIKKNKPMYNRMLKNTKKYVYLKITKKEKFPRLLSAYDKDNDESIYFGPFTSISSVEETIHFLKDAFPIVQCNNPSVSKGVCLNYHLGKCKGICEGLQSKMKYQKHIEEIVDFLKGNKTELLEELEGKMKKSSNDLDFLNAAKYRNQLSGVRNILNIQSIIENSKKLRRTIVIESVDRHLYKIFFIKGSILINRKLLHWTKANITNVDRIIKGFLCDSFDKEKHYKKISKYNNINRDNIDEILITSAYFRKEKDKTKQILVDKFMDLDDKEHNFLSNKLKEEILSLETGTKKE